MFHYYHLTLKFLKTPMYLTNRSFLHYLKIH
jgi:hypothetical protein